MKFFKPNITLFGGEPLINPEIIEIIKIIKSAGMRCNLITNGTLISKYAEDLVNSGLDEIIFSLDGSEKIHDTIRGIPGTYTKALDGFQKLNLIKKNSGINKPLININSTIFESNYQKFQDTIEAAKLFYPDNFTFHHLLFLNKKSVKDFQVEFNNFYGQVPYDWQGFVVNELPKIDSQIIINQIKELKNIKTDFNVSFYPNFNNDDITTWYSSYDFNSKSYQNRCMSLWMTAYIFPDGTVRPYHSMNYDLGNINNDNFLSIWNNEKFIKIRQEIIKNKSFKICSKGCTEFFRY